MSVFSGTGDWYRKILTEADFRYGVVAGDADAAQLPTAGCMLAAPSGKRRTGGVEHDD